MTQLWCKQAWVNGHWSSDVLLEANSQGFWERISPNTSPPTDTTPHLNCAVPGLVNAHSHAFQRVIAGMTERRNRQHALDDFWSWRDRMYAVAQRINNHQLEIVAQWLYREMLQSGFTHVCEFHYLHRGNHQGENADSAEMALALVRAAKHAGIGLTLLPTLYMNRGFGQPGLNDKQRRFASQPQDVLKWQAQIQLLARQQGLSHVLNAGIAFHSLRAVDTHAMRTVCEGLGEAPIHIHIAEQVKEVEDCLRHHGQRPIECLLSQIELDSRWNLVHATHAQAYELEGIARANASVVLCPSTEANLGDGIFDLGTAMSQGLKWSIGTDSHINRHSALELQWLEYSQRLQKRERNLTAKYCNSICTAQILFESALEGNSRACGLPLGGFAVGQRADAVELNEKQAPLLGIPNDHWLDAWVMGQPCLPAQRVWVAGHEQSLTFDKTLMESWCEVMADLNMS